MDPQQAKRRKHLAQVVKVVNDILQGQKEVLQRIANGYRDLTQLYQELNSKIALLDKKIEGGFTVLENTRLASLDKNVSERLKNLDYTYLKELKREIDVIHAKLQQQLQARLFQLLIKEFQKPKLKPSVGAPISKQPRITKQSYRPYAPAAPISVPSAVQSPQTAEVIEEIEGDWTESELEGAKIFDTIIVGWKRRDWEKVKGTKEMFMRAWKKLSNVDRQKIKNGAWSKPIMNKLKLLGREL